MRESEMVRRYGEVCTKTDACKIIRVSKTTLYKLISSGQIGLGCGGTKVDVRSLAAYIDSPRIRWYIPK